MKLPDDVRRHLLRLFENRHRRWLVAGDENRWPVGVDLGLPAERDALRQPEGVRVWVAAWREWERDACDAVTGTGRAGSLVWSERHWRSLGRQRLPERLVLRGPEEVAAWIGQEERWRRAVLRFRDLVGRRPALASALPRHFDVLADYEDADFHRLRDMLAWLDAHPHSQLYARQLPIAGVDSKWLEGRRRLLADLVAALRGEAGGEQGFFERLGLKAPPRLIRLRVLDSGLRGRIGGLGDVTAPWNEVAALDLPVSRAFIIENLQTGLSFPDLPGAVVFMGLGYHVEILGRLPWLDRAQAFYWGDLDTHGFAILSRARGCLPGLRSILMDEETLLAHRDLWGTEAEPHPAERLAGLTEAEQSVYRGLKEQRWGWNVRLEQERIVWDRALRVIMGLM